MDEKKKLIKAYGNVTGRLPVNLNEVLNVLKHPDVITLARGYLQVHDRTDACQKYQPPWNCAMETEAFAQTVNNGWVGEMHHVMANWCVNCRARMFGEDPGDSDPRGFDWLEDTDREHDSPWLLDCD